MEKKLKDAFQIGDKVMISSYSQYDDTALEADGRIGVIKEKITHPHIETKYVVDFGNLGDYTARASQLEKVDADVLRGLDDIAQSFGAESSEEMDEGLSHGDVRHYTNKLFDYLDNDSIDSKWLAESLLKYMSEDDVKDFCRIYELLDNDENEEDVKESSKPKDVTLSRKEGRKEKESLQESVSHRMTPKERRKLQK